MRSRPVLATLATLAAALGAAGCVSLPTAGPVQSYPVTQGTDAQSQQYVQIVPQPPGKGWSPTDIVKGFLTASASFGSHSDVAREYLTPQEQKVWNPLWSAIVYKDGPSVAPAAVPAEGEAKNTVTVAVSGQEQAYLKGSGNYSVPSAGEQNQPSQVEQTIQLVKNAAGQWRISWAPQELLLTSDSFNYDYQLRDLYFFDPNSRYLVPDPVYVPLLASPEELITGLVGDLIKPPTDWLSFGATNTALPPDTKISSVTLQGVTAVVNLTGTITKLSSNPAALEEVSAQLLQTLSGGVQSGTGGQAVQSVELELNGVPWSPPHTQGNPVQSSSKKKTALGDNPEFYYVDSAGYLDSRKGGQGKPVRLEQIGTGYSQIAVSPDGSYVAALRGSTLYAGQVGAALTKRGTGTGYVSMSWDLSDDLWASTGAQIVMFRGAAGNPHPLSQQVTVNIQNNNVSGPITALRVAPDGVRVALVTGDNSNELTFGAISGAQGASPEINLSQIQLTPVNATNFTGLTWYGPDDVITLADPGPVATEYQVSGGTTTSIPVDPGMRTITASSGNPLITALPHGRMDTDVSLNAAWAPLGSGSVPAYVG
jgi:Lipoprotein LpqB beta-propeller domain/Sporulation and spore germination